MNIRVAAGAPYGRVSCPVPLGQPAGVDVAVDSGPTVFVMHDDEEFCAALQCLIEGEGLRVETYTSPEAFLRAYDSNKPGCLILDVCMPGMNGLDLHEWIRRQHNGLPVIILSAHGNVPMAVRATKAGVVDSSQRPVADGLLLSRVREAIRLDAEARQQQVRCAELAARLALLTPRERQVLDRLVAGKSNKQIAAELGLSPKTIEVHRKRLMKKVRVKSAVDLVRMMLTDGPDRDTG